MATAHADADEAVLKMLDRYGVLMLEDLIDHRATGFQFGTIVSRYRTAEPNERHRAPSNRPALYNSPDEPRVAPRARAQHQEPVAPKR